jgi:hypothetical protein
VWIALVHVGARNASSPLTGVGAYVNAVGPASGANDFRQQLADAVDNLELDLLEIEDAEPLDERRAHYQVDAEIDELETQARRDGALHFGTFHNYPGTD